MRGHLDVQRLAVDGDGHRLLTRGRTLARLLLRLGRIAWRVHRLVRRADGTAYRILVDNPAASAERVVAASLDGVALPVGPGGLRLRPARDGRDHDVRVTLGSRESGDGGG